MDAMPYTYKDIEQLVEIKYPEPLKTESYVKQGS